MTLALERTIANYRSFNFDQQTSTVYEVFDTIQLSNEEFSDDAEKLQRSTRNNPDNFLIFLHHLIRCLIRRLALV